ncbi:DUF6779 domain-containing protein [Nocardia pseudovaccinii]|uniref:DUF6779 domain-containing protein n=1 Tax=Nocardia pseudovaccinii TaxID=189540 RepID=UPI0007C69CEA|nr:DUF6779 domain-containing protein [Nocardia pseudovaccinii]
MVSPSRSSTSRRRRDDAGKLFIGVLILLGLVASVFLVFSDRLQFVRIGLVAALWAAVIGALAATRYRKEATIDKAKVRDLQTVYELQLEREVTARREYELGVEARVRAEVGADAAEMAALRAELTVLRESLQRLFDGDLPMDRPALRADATRIQELPSAFGNSANNSSANADTWLDMAFQQSPSTFTPVFESDHPEPPRFASPFDDPVTAETAIVSADDFDDADIADAEVDSDPLTTTGGWADAFTEDPEKTGVPPRLQPLEYTVPPRLSEPESTASEAEPPEPSTPTPHPEPAPHPTTTVPPLGTATSRRRRRVDPDADSGNSSRRLSVAEIMANLQSEEKGRTGH